MEWNDFIGYAADCGYEAALNLLLLVGPDGYSGDYNEYRKLEEFLEGGAKNEV